MIADHYSKFDARKRGRYWRFDFVLARLHFSESLATKDYGPNWGITQFIMAKII